MHSNSDLIKKLNPQYFWDVDLSGLGASSATRIIIERVFTLGDIDDIKQVISFYGKDDVVEVLKNIPYLDTKSFNFILKLFNQPAEEFKCHRKRQSKPQHWSS